MTDYSIIPECYVDTNLIETIVPPQKAYNHQKGCGTVTKLMQDKLKDKFALGIVDKDKKELKYAEEFIEIINAGNIQLFRHKDTNVHHFLIFINPAIEKWIINSVEAAGFTLKDFGLPDDLKELTKKTKKITSKNNIYFKKLFKELKQKNVKSIIILAEWIRYLKQHPYNANVHEIRALTTQYILG